jgi:chitin deacetylase
MKRTVPIALLVIVAITVSLWKVSNARGFQFFGEIVPSVARTDSVVALTFDDGPSPQHTEDVLSILRERQVRATFFVTGQETERNLNEAKQIVAEGHELGNHSYSHPSMVLKQPATIRGEIERTDEAIRSAGYTGEIFFRPPYCKKLFVLPWYLARSKRTTVTWDIEPESYPEVAKESSGIVRHVEERVQPGSIILLHVMYDSRAESRRALPVIIDRLRARGYRFVTVSELLRGDGA